MIQVFRCGHHKTCGMWADDFVFHVKESCPLCRRNGRIGYKIVHKGNRILSIKLRMKRRVGHGPSLV